MRLFDTHCHINDEKFDEDRALVIERMHQGGIEKAVVIGDATKSADDVLNLISQNGFLYGAYGLHPHDAKDWSEDVKRRIAQVMPKDKIVALGEIGLDYHYDFSDRETQRKVFASQLELAHELDKPVILHIREAHGDAYDILKNSISHGIRIRGIMHCYGGSLESAIEYVKMGLYISFSGSLTFKNAPILTRCAENLPMDRLLIETDSPYMAPVPLRGRRNEPAYVKYVCEKLAEIRGMDAEEVSEITYKNALNAFGLKN